MARLPENSYEAKDGIKKKKIIMGSNHIKYKPFLSKVEQRDAFLTILLG